MALENFLDLQKSINFCLMGYMILQERSGL